MSRGNWNVEVLSSGNVWSSDSTIYRSNDDLSVDVTSTQNKVTLANGSQAFISPETKYVRETLNFTWLEIPESDTFRSKIENYVKNQDYLRITTHLSEQLIGRFIFVRRIWLIGTVDTYDLQAGFDRIE